MSDTQQYPDELASTLVQARSALGITQNELHKRTGISREAVKGYESGRNKPGAREIKLLCESLHISPNLLLFGREDPFSSIGDLYNLIQGSGQLDWAKLSALFKLLTGKEKSSILFLIESILLGRHSHAELKEKLNAMGAISAILTSLMKSGAESEASGKPLDPQKMAVELEMYLQKSAGTKGSPS